MPTPTTACPPRSGRIVVIDNRLVSLDRRWLPGAASSLRIWWDSRYHVGGIENCCTLWYTGTRKQPGFLTLDYIRSTPRTSLRTLRCTLRLLDFVAQRRQAIAIVAHVGTTAISDRLLLRWGWTPHAASLRGRHWIKRFYDGYPETDLTGMGPVAAELISPTPGTGSCPP
jgi:hypothetical protein